MPVLSRFLLILSLLSFFPASSVFADEAKPIFAEYEATYKLNWHGLPVGKSTHKLQKMGDNHYSVESRSVPSIPVPLQDFEKSEFLVKGNLIQPKIYHFNTHDKRKKIEGSLLFNWKEMHVQKDLKGETNPTIYPIALNAHDKMTQFFQLRRDLKMGKNLNYTVVEHKGVKPYQYKIIGKEKLKTPIGTLNTIIVEHISLNKKRCTRVWLAEELDYVMVKLVQIRNQKVTAEALIQNYSKR